MLAEADLGAFGDGQDAADQRDAFVRHALGTAAAVPALAQRVDGDADVLREAELAHDLDAARGATGEDRLRLGDATTKRIATRPLGRAEGRLGQLAGVLEECRVEQCRAIVAAGTERGGEPQ